MVGTAQMRLCPPYEIGAPSCMTAEGPRVRANAFAHNDGFVKPGTTVAVAMTFRRPCTLSFYGSHRHACSARLMPNNQTNLQGRTTVHSGRVVFGAMDEVVFGRPAAEAIV